MNTPPQLQNFVAEIVREFPVSGAHFGDSISPIGLRVDPTERVSMRHPPSRSRAKRADHERVLVLMPSFMAARTTSRDEKGKGMHF